VGCPTDRNEDAEHPALARIGWPVTGAELFSKQRWRDLAVHFGFSRRQLQVARLVCEALESKQIACELAVSLDTVRLHLREIYRKLHVNNRVGLVVKLVVIERLLPGGSRADASAESTALFLPPGDVPHI
jgi:DNA-binding CsgD family transcriptional regulator